MSSFEACEPSSRLSGLCIGCAISIKWTALATMAVRGYLAVAVRGCAVVGDGGCEGVRLVMVAVRE